MITKPCDRCERIIEVEDNRAGTKVECPFCHDMNIMPGVKPTPAADPGARLAAHRPPVLDIPAALHTPQPHRPHSFTFPVSPD